MPPFDIAFLTGVVSAFTIFGLTLAYVSFSTTH